MLYFVLVFLTFLLGIWTVVCNKGFIINSSDSKPETQPTRSVATSLPSTSLLVAPAEIAMPVRYSQPMEQGHKPINAIALRACLWNTSLVGGSSPGKLTASQMRPPACGCSLDLKPH